MKISRRVSVCSMFMLVLFLNQLFFPITAYALSGGPSQPEVESFEPVGTSDMVDLFSGDFNYNIPLFDVDGYPVNIAYHSGVTTDQEASWVGLGWNLNPGVITRNLRGLPDDFSGDEVKKTSYIKPDITVGVNFGKKLEVFGIEKKPKIDFSVSAGLGINYNNYKGLGVERFIAASLNAGVPFKNSFLKSLGVNAGAKITSSSRDGLSIQPKLGLSAKMWESKGFAGGHTLSAGPQVSVGMAINSRSGMKSLTFKSSVGLSLNQPREIKKTKELTTKIGNSSTISFGTQTYTPAMATKMSNGNISISLGAGPAFYGVSAIGFLQGYYSSQGVAEIHATRAAYGYMNSEARKNNDNAIMDLNREKDGSFSEKSPVLAIPMHTYDLFTASGQGVSGMFRANRSESLMLFDPAMNTTSNGGSIDLEAGVGNLVKIGANGVYNHGKVSSGTWVDGLGNLFVPKDKDMNSSNPYFEPYYFKTVGEKSTNENNLAAYQEMDGVLRPIITSYDDPFSTNDAHMKKLTAAGSYQDVAISSWKFKRTERAKRNQLMSTLKVSERKYCVQEDIEYYEYGTSEPLISNIIPRNDAERKSHHITEVNVIKDNGMRYVYGVPAYNNKQLEYFFTNARNPDVSGSPTICRVSGLVSYDHSNIDDYSARAYKGNDHQYSKTLLPAYAHSYLLTSVLSPDYMDSDNINGPSENDNGTYTKISYYRVHANYKWREPFAQNKANYNEGYKSDDTDDGATVTFGEKEIWLTRSIEGKTQKATFYISPRQDGYGVADVNGGLGNDMQSYKLDSIKIIDKLSNKTLKTVHFEYDYSLCPNTPNRLSPSNTVGKLTLKKLWFTYGLSSQGEFNPYTFTYKETAQGGYFGRYYTKGYDRWGYYKPNPNAAHNDDLDECDAVPLSNYAWEPELMNYEFPYVEQNKTNADNNMAVWNLTKIELPSGGVIEVQYEADDYAYVQNRRAMQMTKVSGFSPSATNGCSTSLSNLLYNDNCVNDRIFFPLPDGCSGMSNAAFKQYILEGNNNTLYYNFLVNLTSTNAQNYNYEYIRGYAKILDAGIDNNKGWVQVEKADNHSNHPISKSAWQFARIHLPWLVYPGSDLRKRPSVEAYAEAIARGLLGYIFETADMIRGNDKLRTQNFGRDVICEKSWIRINNMNGAKLGGGCRVKQITLSDNWNNMVTGGQAFSYGQKYEYTQEDNYNGASSIISSGVASYEPANGGDENAFKMPVSYDHENWGVPDNEFYAEEPFGESYFPSPQVGYSRVTVKNLDHSGVTKNATGKTVFEFYTAREFPVFTSRTSVDVKDDSPTSLLGILGFMSEEHTIMTQGLQIELNDMHGKEKAVWHYSEAKINSSDIKDAYSGITYTYQTDPATSNTTSKKLNNTFQVINKNNTISNAEVGVEAELLADNRKHSSESWSGGVITNTDIVYVVPPPVVPPVFLVTFFGWPDLTMEKTSFKSSVLFRVINRFGILKKTTAFEEGASVSTENLLLDAETGEVVLSSTQNEFQDNIYTTNLPAHWAYDAMGQAYKNIGLEFKIRGITSDPGQFTFQNTALSHDHLVSGDELIVDLPGGSVRAWVYKNDNVVPVHTYLMNKAGALLNIPVSSDVLVKVIRSGRRNQHNLPIASVTSMASPLVLNALAFSAGTKVLQANATEYYQKWRVPSPLSSICSDYTNTLELAKIFKHLIETDQINLFESDATKTIQNVGLTSAAVYNNSVLKNIREYYHQPHDFKIENDPSPGVGYYINFKVGCNDLKVRLNKLDFSGLTSTQLASISSVSVLEETLRESAVGLVFTYNNGGTPTNLQVDLTFEGSHVNLCKCLPPDNNMQVNPYVVGILGNWRSQKSWVYFDNRNTQASAGGQTNIRTDGTYQSFSSFWFWSPSPSGGNWIKPSTASKWVQTTQTTKYGKYGNPLEEVDALGNYSAVLYDNEIQKPVMVANNAKYQQIGYVSAEPSTISCSDNSHLIREAQPLSNDEAVSHTGIKSLVVGANCSRRFTNLIYDENHTESVNTEGEYTMEYKDQLGLFNPYETAPVKYMISAWVKVGTDPKIALLGSTGASITVDFWKGNAFTQTIAPASYTFTPSGPVIEGWQKIEGVFEVPSGVQPNGITEVGVVLTGASHYTWFDDLRIHPQKASVKTYVYGERNGLLMAELDENNYATFYEYNGEGKLIRVKKETERGIVTIKEARTLKRKQSN